jgi:hypothetical protein
MIGWIKIHRQILNWEWYSDNNAFRVFMHLILKANHKDRRFKGIELKAGSVVTSRDILAIETGLSVRQIRTALDKLKTTNEVTIKTSSKGTIIQVVNYEKYQIETSEATNERPTNDQQTTTNKNVKKEKKTIVPSFSEFLAYALENKPNLNKVDVELKYKSWIANDWCTNKDGKPKPISNWKVTLLNTIPYLSTIEVKLPNQIID